jgi:hypothetical protein
MIFALVVFVAAAQPVYSMRSRETFATMAACHAFLEAEEPRLFLLAAQATAQAGRTVTVRASCVAGPET